MRQVARVLLRNPEGKYILVKHLKGKAWTLPGGHIKKGESIYKAAKREVLEELNLKIKLLGETDDFGLTHVKNLPMPLSIYKIEYESRKWGHQKKMEYIFHAEVDDVSHIKVQEEEIASYQWFTPEEIKEMGDVFVQIPKLLEKVT